MSNASATSLWSRPCTAPRTNASLRDSGSCAIASSVVRVAIDCGGCPFGTTSSKFVVVTSRVVFRIPVLNHIRGNTIHPRTHFLAGFKALCETPHAKEDLLIEVRGGLLVTNTTKYVGPNRVLVSRKQQLIACPSPVCTRCMSSSSVGKGAGNWPPVCPIR